MFGSSVQTTPDGMHVKLQTRNLKLFGDANLETMMVFISFICP